MAENTISAGSNPALANNLINKALNESPEAQPAPAEIKAPLDTTVELPGGFVTSAGEVLRTAEVRELNGKDEEAIVKHGNVFRAMNTILGRGTVKIGDLPVTDEILDNLLSADRDALALGIYRATFGNEAEIGAYCSGCGAIKTVAVDVTTDIKTKILVDPLDDRTFEIEIGKNTYKVSLPNGKAQKELLAAADKTGAELTTLFLEHCISAINGRPVLSKSQIQSIGIKDRRKLTEEISDRNVGPQFADVTVECPDCGGEVGVPINLGTLFQF